MPHSNSREPAVPPKARILTHEQVWTALDRLAARAGLSASGLAKRAGLDPTTFNKSKRITPDGRARWPSTESVSKSLAATTEAGNGGYFDDGGFPVGKGWDEVATLTVSDEHAYALEISGDSMRPAYRDGDIIIVSPGASVRKGDRVVVKTKSGEVMAKELRRRSTKTIELGSFNPSHRDRTFAAKDIEWLARIIWASQ